MLIRPVYARQDASCDAVTCQYGLSFAPDVAAAMKVKFELVPALTRRPSNYTLKLLTEV